MVNFSDGYKVVPVEDKTNYIAADHRKKELQISNDINVSRTNNGKLCATFQNSEQKKPTVSDFVGELFGKKYSSDNPDCSITINDESKFHYCKRENGEYKLFGSDVTFKGTDKADKLTMYECENTTVNLGKGDDTVKVEGAKPGGFPATFQNNKINTENGNDTVSVSGNFNKFTGNKFNLGKGNDSFKAEINPEDDANVKTASDYNAKENIYSKNVSGSEVQATDTKKGWFEKDTFESKTYSGNQLALSKFEPKNVITKAEPEKPIAVTHKTVQPKVENKTELPKKLTYKEKHEKAQQKYQINSLLYGLTGKAEFAEKFMEGAQDASDACK